MVRRGPLRAVVARHPTHDVLACGHWYMPTRRWSSDALPRLRRCPLCPEAKRASYFRAYDQERAEDQQLRRADA